ncbi:EF-hand domain-containing protein [Plasmodiophora brassicae]|uniref:EF-hand domain-containing protein n=1 Tax=Plasmodiophora brassicae TaxID=37360 RepID=A0A0G4IQ29_PLABS|nr:hypothetical protein PBRA_000601 [Plasmodiophora brassicae]SPQ97563.1 unnamed protein product [Plasmodiophora brassicae]
MSSADAPEVETVAAPEPVADPDASIKQAIKDAFDLFDRDGKGIIVKEEVGTIMRYMGAYPTEEELVMQILPRIREDEDSHFIKYDRFETMMVDVIKNRDFEPDLEDIVLQAFKVIDHERKGFVSDYRMIQLLSSNEYKFRQKELEQFLKVAKDDNNDKIYYEDYVAILAKDLEEIREQSKQLSSSNPVL